MKDASEAYILLLRWVKKILGSFAGKKELMSTSKKPSSSIILMYAFTIFACAGFWAYLRPYKPESNAKPIAIKDDFVYSTENVFGCPPGGLNASMYFKKGNNIYVIPDEVDYFFRRTYSEKFKATTRVKEFASFMRKNGPITLRVIPANEKGTCRYTTKGFVVGFQNKAMDSGDLKNYEKFHNDVVLKEFRFHWFLPAVMFLFFLYAATQFTWRIALIHYLFSQIPFGLFALYVQFIA